MQVSFTNTDLTAGTVDGKPFAISATGKLWVNRNRPSKAAAAAIEAAQVAERAAVAAAAAAAFHDDQHPGAVERAAPAADTTAIKLLVKVNPKREGSAAYDRFKLYFNKGVTTVAAALAAGLTRKDLAWDQAHGFIKLAD